MLAVNGNHCHPVKTGLGDFEPTLLLRCASLHRTGSVAESTFRLMAAMREKSHIATPTPLDFSSMSMVAEETVGPEGKPTASNFLVYNFLALPCGAETLVQHGSRGD